MKSAALLVGLALCVGGCDDDPTVALPDATPPPPLSLVIDHLDAALFGLWGASDDDLWFVGGDGNPTGGVVWHSDGAIVRREDSPPGPRLWWIWGADGEHQWACGEGGRILARRDGGWRSEPTGLGDKAVLWGLWGSSAEDLWAVGGSVRRGGPKGLLLRSTGDGVWRRVEDPALPSALNLYKVWGRSAAEIYLVGEGGVVLRWDGAGFTRQDVGVRDLLFTVHGAPTGPVLAVGGLSGGLVFRHEGEGPWQPDGPEGAPPLNGVLFTPSGRALAVGGRGTILARQADGRWTQATLAGAEARTLHALWAGDHVWAVGGDLVAGTDGLIATDRTPAPRLEAQ